MKTNLRTIQPIVTEKSSLAQSNGKYTFMVPLKATKVDIKKAIKELYGADVSTVRTMLAPSKIRMLKGKYEWAKRPVMKKAIVTLKGKKTIIDPGKIGSKSEKAEKETKEKVKTTKAKK